MILFYFFLSISNRLVRTYNSILSYNRWSNPLHFFQYNNGERIQVCTGVYGIIFIYRGFAWCANTMTLLEEKNANCCIATATMW